MAYNFNHYEIYGVQLKSLPKAAWRRVAVTPPRTARGQPEGQALRLSTVAAALYSFFYFFFHLTCSSYILVVLLLLQRLLPSYLFFFFFYFFFFFFFVLLVFLLLLPSFFHFLLLRGCVPAYMTLGKVEAGLGGWVMRGCFGCQWAERSSGKEKRKKKKTERKR